MCHFKSPSQIKEGIELNLANVEVAIEADKCIVSVKISDNFSKVVYLSTSKCDHGIYINFRHQNEFQTIFIEYINSQKQLGFIIGVGLCRILEVAPKTENFLMRYDNKSYYVVYYNLSNYVWLDEKLKEFLSYKYSFLRLFNRGMFGDVLHIHLYDSKHFYKLEITVGFNKERTLIEKFQSVNVFLYEDNMLVDYFNDVEIPQLKKLL